MTPVEKIVVIGGSAGAIPSLMELARALPIDFPAAIFVTIHLAPQFPSFLPQLLESAGPLPARHPDDGELIRRGRIYVALPDFHLLIADGRVNLARGAKENHHRPAIDPLFRSAAASYGANVIAVLLSGFLDDGTVGLMAISRCGGTVIVQDPNDTIYSDMPKNALLHVKADHVLPMHAIAGTLKGLTSQPIRDAAPNKEAAALRRESSMVKVHSGARNMEKMPGRPSSFVCPECNGTLWEIEEGDLIRFRCHEGHAYSPLSMEASQTESLEAALWVALRTLDEKIALADKLEVRSRNLGQILAVERYHDQKAAADRHAQMIRRVLNDGQIGARLSPLDTVPPVIDDAPIPKPATVSSTDKGSPS